MKLVENASVRFTFETGTTKIVMKKENFSYFC